MQIIKASETPSLGILSASRGLDVDERVHAAALLEEVERLLDELPDVPEVALRLEGHRCSAGCGVLHGAADTAATGAWGVWIGIWMARLRLKCDGMTIEIPMHEEVALRLR